MESHPVSSGDEVIKQGEVGEYFYVIESGEFAVIVNGSEVNTYQQQGSFGELALVYSRPRAATVLSRSDGMLWKLSRAAFRQVSSSFSQLTINLSKV